MTSPSDILKQRGIYNEAMKAGWTEGARGWEYPILNLAEQEIARRSKAYDSKAKFKYAWIPSKPDNPQSDYYILPGTLEAIREAGGVAYLCNGEASVLAMHAAGICNSFSTTHGEATVPKTILAELKLLGVTKLINIADKDKAGLKAACNWREALRDSSVEYQAKQWPEYLPEKSDFNDLWIAVNFDSYAARIALENCQALILPQPEVKTVIPIGKIDETPQGLIDLIAHSLRNRAWKGRGEWINGLSIFRDEQKESAGFNLKTGVYHDFTTGDKLAPRKVAEQLGIDWKPFYPKVEKPKRASSRRLAIKPESTPLDSAEIMAEMPPKPIYINTAWIDQDELPLWWEKAMLQICHAKSASPVYAIRFHQAIRKGLLDGQKMSIKDIMQALDVPRLSCQAFIDFLLSLNFLWILSTSSLEEGLETESINKSKKKGRPEIYYALNTHTDSLAIALAERLEPILIERLSEDLERAPRSHTMREALDLSLDEYKLWAKRNNTSKHDYILELVRNRICDVLENTTSISFSEEDLAHPQNLRGKLAKMELEPYSERTVVDSLGNTVVIPRVGVQLSRAKLTLELGCSKASLSKLYEDNNIGHKRIYASVEVENANDCEIEKEIREAAFRLNKEIGGRAYAIYIRYHGQTEKLPLFYGEDMVKAFHKYNGRIEKLFVLVEQPSLLWNMTTEEIEEKRANEAKAEAKLLKQAETEEERAEVVKTLERKTEKKERKPSFVAGRDELTTGHRMKFLREQIENEVKEDFSPYVLKGLSIVQEGTGEIVASLKGLKEVVVWLNHYETKPAVVAPKPLPVIEVPKPVVVAKPVNSPEWCWANHPEEFNERMRAIGAMK